MSTSDPTGRPRGRPRKPRQPGQSSNRPRRPGEPANRLPPPLPSPETSEDDLAADDDQCESSETISPDPDPDPDPSEHIPTEA